MQRSVMQRNRAMRSDAFTLIELLVVVAIMSLLMAMLLPGLSAAREASKRIACQNNIRSIWTGILTYTIETNDMLPFAEDININDPNADPFDTQYPTTIGVLLMPYVTPGSWRCPGAVAGFPADAEDGRWSMTYELSTAGAVGEGVPYQEHPDAHSGGPLDPAVSNYVHLDGRPLRLLDGRRYVQSWGLNKNRKGFWNVRRAIIADRVSGQKDLGRPRYPHVGVVDGRRDLEAARDQFMSNTLGGGKKPSYYELHADGDRVEILLTRYWVPHQEGF